MERTNAVVSMVTKKTKLRCSKLNFYKEVETVF